MKRILTILLVLWSLNSTAQSRLGFSYQEVYDEFPDEIVDFTFGKDILIEFTFFSIFHIFNEDLVCIRTTIIAHNEKAAAFFHNKLDGESLALSDTTWAKAMDGYNIYCKMSYMESIQKVVFIWEY